MSLLEINIGAFANDGTGDDLREAFRKVNLNFQELDLRDDESTTASNLGVNGEGVFAQKLNYDLQFKKLVAGKDVSLTSNDERIVITANGGVKSVLVSSDQGTAFLEEVASLNVLGGNNIKTSIAQNTITVDYTGLSSLVTDPDPRLGANLDASGKNISNVGTIDANSIISNFYGSVYSTDNSSTLVNANTKVIDLSNTSIGSLKDVNFTPDSIISGQVLAWDGVRWSPAAGAGEFNIVNNFENGSIIPQIQTFEQWIFYQTEFDLGTITNPSIVDVDLGAI